MTQPAPRKVIIIGGVAGGASCAARLRRLDENVEVLMVERGPYVSYANRSGQRAYMATRVLLQQGFSARTLSGGTMSRVMLVERTTGVGALSPPH